MGMNFRMGGLLIYPESADKKECEKMTSAKVACCKYLQHHWHIQVQRANSVDPDQTGATLFGQEASESFRQTTKSDDICCEIKL